MGYLELMLMNNDSSVAICDLVKTKDIVVKGLNEIEEMHDAAYYYKKGQESQKNRKFNEALCWYRKALRIDPDHLNTLYCCGVCYLPSNCHLGFSFELYGIDESVCSRRAVKCLERLIDLRKTKYCLEAADSGVFNNLGCAYGNLGENKKEEDAFRTAIKLNENDPCPQDNLGNIFLDRGLLDEAERFYLAALNADKDYLITYYHLGQLYIRKKRNEDALKWFGSFLEKVDRTDTWENARIRDAVDAIDCLKELK
jgi:tetratricopeptide (TPR) repeat protein